MSCSCCCCCETPSRELLDGIRKKERLVTEEEEERKEAGGEEEEESRRKMDISLLREQYRCTRETQKRRTQVLLLRTVSEELSDAVSIVPLTQGLMVSPWEPKSSLTPAITLDPDPTAHDPWHIHLGLHRLHCPSVTAQLTTLSPETEKDDSSSLRSSSSSEAVSSQHAVDSMSDSRSSSRETSPCRSLDHTKEDHFNADWSRGDPGTGSCEGPRGDPHTVDPVQVCVSGSLDASEKNPSDRSKPAHPDCSFSDSQELSAVGSLSISEESSTPVTSITCPLSGSTISQYEDLKENQSAGRKHSNGFMQNSSTPSAWRGSRKVSAPVLKFTRQLSVGGVGSTMGIHQSQNYHPFPKRKIPRISEAARRLGMYSSF